MPEVNERLARILKENPVTQIPAEMLLIFRVLGLMSGLQKRLDSQVSMFDTIIPTRRRRRGRAASSRLRAGEAAAG